MTAAGETTEQHGHTETHAGLGRVVPIQPMPDRAADSPGAAGGTDAEEPASRPVTGQQRAHRVLAELLDQAAAHNLPSIDWTLAAFEPRLIGRCTAYPGPGRRRADFEAWRALLGAQAAEERNGEQPVRLTARADRDEGRVTIEIAADLYDDVPDTASPSAPPASGNGWRTP
jgi:hypothetical protein